MPLPEHWTEKHKDMDYKDFLYMKKIPFSVHPCFLYLRDNIARLAATPPVLNLNRGRPAYGSHVHVHRDARGKIHHTNLKNMLERLVGGEEFFNECLEKDMQRRDWLHEIHSLSKLKPLIHSLKKQEDFDPQHLTSRQTHLSSTAKQTEVEGMQAYEVIQKHYQALDKHTRDWKRGKSNFESAMISIQDNCTTNSSMNRRGYKFITNPRLRSSSTSVKQPSLISSVSQSRYQKTQASFKSPANSSANVLHYRIENNQINMGVERDTKSYYLNRINERTEESELRRPELPHKQLEDNQPQRDERRADEENLQDPFEQFERQQAHQPDLEPDLPDTDFNATNYGTNPKLKDPSSTNYHTNNTRYFSLPRRALPQPPQYQPLKKDLTQPFLRSSMNRSTGSQFFNARMRVAHELNFRRTTHSKMYNSFVGSDAPTSSVNPDSLQTMNRFSLAYNGRPSHQVDQMLITKASRDAARQYQDIVKAKAKISSVVPGQSLESLKTALLIPDTTVYSDLSKVAFPMAGSRLLCLEPQEPKKPKPKKKVLKG